MLGLVSIIGIIIGIIIIIGSSVKKVKEGKMLGTIVTIVAIVIMLSQSFVIIDAGEVGVQVMFGKVLEQTLSEGFNPKPPVVDVVTYEVRLQEYTMSSSHDEGDIRGDDASTVITKDNLELSIDMSIWYSINGSKASDIYKKIAKNSYDLKRKIIRPAVKNVLRDVSTRYTFKETIAKRNEYAQEMETALKEVFDDKGIDTDRVLIRKVDPPMSVKKSIENKLVQQQNLETKQLELEKASKDAEIRRVNAQGLADAQEIILKKLDPLYVQYEAIQSYKELAKSENTTFVIAPTDPKASGMPMILNLENGKKRSK